MRTPTPEQRIQINNYNRSLDILIDFYKKLYQKYDKNGHYINDQIHYNPKREGKNKGQWGYYINYAIGELLYTLDALKAKSILDLGSGSGILLYYIYKYSIPRIDIMGYEIEQRLITIANKIIPNKTKKKNILTLRKSDIEKYDVIYFWEPLADRELAKKFVDNLTKIINKNQTIIYYPSGSILEHFYETKKYDITRSEVGPYRIIKLKD